MTGAAEWGVLVLLAALVACCAWDSVTYRRTMRELSRELANQRTTSPASRGLDLDTVEPSPQGVTS